ncbi:MAG: hypothetical protein H6Q90_7073, partial [Deltaproteobacteria bacterium]|nr:hypothetical protein [Deltaproteobacteria bacterium]
MNRLPLLVVALVSCKSAPEPQLLPVTDPTGGPDSPAMPAEPPAAVVAERRHDAISRTELNRWAVRENLPLYWTIDADKDGNLDPDEVA